MEIDLHNLYSAPDIVREVKLKTIRWARHVAQLIAILFRKPEQRSLRGGGWSCR
jgi:hypothetical protein